MLTLGARLGPYEIGSQLGSGGMGVVYQARDTKLDRTVAVKVLSDDMAQDPEMLARFEREAKALATLNHPNILGIHDFGVDGSTVYAVMEFLEGKTLRQLVQQGPLPLEDVKRITVQILDGLAAAHNKGIVHRDLKPENVFVLSDGRVKLLDFGLVKLVAAATEDGEDSKTLPAGAAALTQRGMVLGTVGYMSPEQVMGHPADTRSDIFALGCIVLEMMTGRRAFPGGNWAESASSILKDRPEGLDRLPDIWRSVLDRCLDKSPSGRWPHAQALTEALSDHKAISSPHVLPTIGVLPFRDMSPTQDLGYLCEGLAEEILDTLAGLGGLHVASRAASFRFKSTDEPRRIGAELGVSVLLEGSVRKDGERIRISVQLLEAATGFQRWSQKSDHSLDDLFKVQESIARSVAEALSVVLGGGEEEKLKRRSTESTKALDWFLRARKAVNRGRAKDLRLAVNLYRKALDQDPAFVKAYAGLADALTWLHEWQSGDPADLDAALEASAKALELEAESPQALAAHGHALSVLQRFSEAKHALEAALGVDPAFFDALYWAGHNAFRQGRFKEQADYYARASAADPSDFQSALYLGLAHQALHHAPKATEAFEEAAGRAQRYLEAHPGDGRAICFAGHALIHLGRKEEALQLLESMKHQEREDLHVLYNLACNYALLGRAGTALQCLDGVLHLPARRYWAAKDPDLASLHALPRFRQLLGMA